MYLLLLKIRKGINVFFWFFFIYTYVTKVEGRGVFSRWKFVVYLNVMGFECFIRELSIVKVFIYLDY